MTIHTIEVPEWSAEPVRIREPSLGEFADLVDARRLNSIPEKDFAFRLVGLTLLNGSGEQPVGEAWLRESLPASRYRGFGILLQRILAILDPPPEEPSPP